MDVVVEIWKAKVTKEESKKELNKDSKESKDKRDKSITKNRSSTTSKMSRPSKTTKRKRTRCKKTKNASLTTLAKNARTNCCNCCAGLMEYFSEVVNLVCNRCNGEPRISELLKELYEIAGCICHDCFSFIKLIFRFLVVFKK